MHVIMQVKFHATVSSNLVIIASISLILEASFDEPSIGKTLRFTDGYNAMIRQVSTVARSHSVVTK